MNLRLIAILVAGILLAHAVLIHLLLKTESMTNSAKEMSARQEEPQKNLPSPDAALPPPQDLPAQQSGTDKAVSSASAPEMSKDPEVVPGIPPLKEKKIPAQKRVLDFSHKPNSKVPKIAPEEKNVSGILVDLDSNRVLWERNSSKSCPIASMSKLMTLLIAYEKATDGTLPAGLDTVIPVTKEATKIPPSSVYMAVGEKFTLRELMTAAAVKSANDAAWLIGQYIGGGKISVFVDMMNKRAAELGMKNTVFYNPHGLSGATKNQDNRSTAADMVLLCSEFMRHRQLCEWSSLRFVEFRKPSEKGYMKLTNHNNLLPGARFGTKGVSGLKTGYTYRAGYCVAATCTRDGRDLLAIVTGFSQLKARDTFVRSLLDWGYKQAPSR